MTEKDLHALYPNKAKICLLSLHPKRLENCLVFTWYKEGWLLASCSWSKKSWKRPPFVTKRAEKSSVLYLKMAEKDLLTLDPKKAKKGLLVLDPKRTECCLLLDPKMAKTAFFLLIQRGLKTSSKKNWILTSFTWSKEG